MHSLKTKMCLRETFTLIESRFDLEIILNKFVIGNFIK